MECKDCGFARTFPIGEANRNDTRDCEACGGEETFGPGRYWLRPPGFAHPIDIEEVTSPDDMPETSYATRAKLTMGTPGDEGSLDSGQSTHPRFEGAATPARIEHRTK